MTDDDSADDPFARLDEGEPETEPDAEGSLFGEAKPGGADRDPVDADADGAGTDDAASDSRPTANAGGTEVDDPFDELGPATGETDAELEDAFERMDVGGVAEEDVWESLDEDTAGEFGPAGGLGGAASETGASDTHGTGFGGSAGVERVISKRTYCQQCPHFSAPPDVACGHEGTTILEAVGFDEFRVRNCPMVDEDDPTFDAGRGE